MNLVPSRKQVAYKPFGTKGGLSGPKRVPRPLFNNIVLVARDNTTVVAYINKEGGMKSGALCALLWRILTWCTRRQATLKARRIPGQLAEYDSRQAIQTRSNHSNRMVPSPRGLPSHLFPVAPAPGGSICHQVQQQTSTVCLTGSRPPSMGSGCTQPFLGESGSICLPTSSQFGQSGGESCRTTHATE